MKSLIASKNVPYPLVHDLSALMQILASSGEVFDAMPDVLYLNNFAVYFRYNGMEAEDIAAFDVDATLRDVLAYVDRAASVINPN